MVKQGYQLFKAVGLICIFLIYNPGIYAQIGPDDTLSEFVNNLSFKGPIIGSTDNALNDTNNWVGSSIMYPSKTRFVNWEFSFSHNGLESSIAKEIEVLIEKNGQSFGRLTSKVMFDHNSGMTEYIDGYGSDTERIWEAGVYNIEWSIDGNMITHSEFTILNDDLTKTEIIQKIRRDAFEIYFKESTEAKRDYTYFDNYNFPQKKVGLIGWRITFNVPYAIHNYELDAHIKIWNSNSELVAEGPVDVVESAGLFPGIQGEVPWHLGGNWLRGFYRMEIYIEDRSLASKEFLII